MSAGTASIDLERPLTEAEFRRLARLSRLPMAWIANSRRRRLLVLALAAPGFLAIVSTPIHQNLFVLVSGMAGFLAALLFRWRTERVFVRAEAAALWPPAPPALTEIPHD